MDASPSVASKISFEEAGSDRVTGMRHHRERDSRQHGLQQQKVIVAKASRPVRREGIANPDPMRRVATRTKAHDLGKIVGSTGAGELLENWKIKQRLGSGEPPAQLPPGIARPAGGLRLSGKIGEWAVQNILFIFVAALKLLRLNGMRITPPGITVTAPLRM
jgi:hypothetical protein